MKSAAKATGFLLSVAVLALPATAAAEYGIKSFDVRTDANAAGDPFTQASGHPYSITTHIEWNNHPDDEEGYPRPDADPHDALAHLPAGMLGNPTIGPRCTAIQLAPIYTLAAPSTCPIGSQVGVIHTRFNFTDFYNSGNPSGLGTYPLFNMEPPTGRAARFGFKVLGVPLYLDAELNEGDYTLTVGQRSIPEALRLIGADITFWGLPADSSHDFQRCNLAAFGFGAAGCAAWPPSLGGAALPSDAPKLPFLTLPSSCPPKGIGQEWTMRTDSWQNPGVYDEETVFSHLAPFAPEPLGPQQGTEGCELVPFSPKLTAVPTTQSAGSATGLSVKLTVPSDGLENPDGLAQSHLKKAVFTLPEGVTLNPSQAEGLGVCSPSQYAEERLGKSQAEGCPPNSKVGSVIVHTPALEETLDGSVYVAQPDDPKTASPGAENPFDSLIAIYVVLRNHERGINVKLAGKVQADPQTGQIVTSFDDLPQVPFSSFDFKFREGPRAPLTTPDLCGTYESKALLYPWARPEQPTTSTSAFQVNEGPNETPCPSSGIPPFKPAFSAGSINNNAASYTPFNMRLIRSDGEQDMTKFSSILPPGVLGKLAGVSKCPDSAIAIAKAKSGKEEQASPSCPANSQVGRISAGAGVGSVLTYVGGKVYLGGPYNGDPLSVIVITPAVAGPFDIGTVITREALTLNPLRAEVEVDGKASDPIPHILKGIPLKLRELWVDVDRDNFILNPTSCEPSSAKATLFGSFLDVLSPADDRPVELASRFQAADCLNLGFKPKLDLKLKGGTKRGGHPGLRATYRTRKGDANLKGLTVRLPSSAFLDQGHIRTICTRVQFSQDNCPKGAQYGYIMAFTPLLEEPLEGPVYLRSSNHNLPDLVFDLHGLVDVEVATRVDSQRGGIRATVKDAPDAPISKVILEMQGQRKGLIVNSRDLCASTNRANVAFGGQNGKQASAKPALRAQCGGRGHKGHRR